MAENTINPRSGELWENLQNDFEQEFVDLEAAHATHAVEFEAAYIENKDLLLLVMSEECPSRNPPNSRVSSDASSRTPDVTGATRGEKTPSMPSEEINPKLSSGERGVLVYVHEALMSKAMQERMGAFKRCLEGVRDGTSPVGCLGGASSSTDPTERLQKCIEAMRTMKKIITTKFECFLMYIKRHTHEDKYGDELKPPNKYFNSPRLSGGLGRSRTAHPSVISSNPQSNATGDTGLSEARQPAFQSGLKTNQVPPSHSRSHRASEIDQGTGSQSSSKKPSLTRQDAMDDEGFD